MVDGLIDHTFPLFDHKMMLVQAPTCLLWSSDGVNEIEFFDGLPQGFVGGMQITQGDFQLGMPQALLYFQRIHPGFQQHCGVGVPLRYNRVKSEKPRKIKGFRSFGQGFSSFSNPKNRVPAAGLRKEMFH